MLFELNPLHLAEGLVWYIVFLFSTVCHEAAHAFASLKLADRTAHEGGQVTLDPLPHIRREPIGMVVIPIVSFLMSGWMMGWASAPYDPAWAMRYPRRSALMALAGPSANFVLFAIAFLMIRAGVAFEWFYAPDSITFSQVTVAVAAKGVSVAVAKFLSILFSLNLILCVFNLLPLPPLDGSSIFPLFLERRMGQEYLDFLHRNRSFAFFGLYVAWQFFHVIFNPIHLFVLNLLYPGLQYH
ncbi:hypothetical protein U14_04728 [Candidatus Moduliflexus flocculans]|uniref:Peptidase M50 domain-containing protein n=1 Tax=Candidatus Moduliflexus flocculans TaxID=1499966 RepID=A0A0S6W124_9BACT|nr:hypothetical protein U14_04728 [Candidatus Moduliflexus flocculans]